MSIIRHISRREFLSKTGKAVAGAIAAGTLASCGDQSAAPLVKGRTLGSNDTVNIAVIGIRNQGMALAKGFAKLDKVHIRTLCDIDENLFGSRAKEIADITGAAPLYVGDLRRVCDDKDVDAIVIATPNHWHALAAVWACQAGKHVYVEKPCSHNIFEGRKIVEAARKYNRVVQVGFQNRSMQNVRQAMKLLHDGGIGEVYMARALCFKRRDPIGKVPDGIGDGPKYKYFIWNEPGENYDVDYMSRVDYALWLGPAPVRPFNYNRFHYNWHWNWDYGNGDIGNQGPHQFDIARWGLNKNEHPVRVYSTGGYFGPESDQQTPNVQSAVFKYADGKVFQFDVRGLFTNDEAAMFAKVESEKSTVADPNEPNSVPEIPEAVAKLQEGITIGNLFYGTKGWMYLNGTTWKTYLGRDNEPGPCSGAIEESADPASASGTGAEDHYKNFIAALRTGKKEDLNCDIEAGFMSTALPHLANISYRLGRSVEFDGKRERFVNDGRADLMLTRRYRYPYIVPQRV